MKINLPKYEISFGDIPFIEHDGKVLVITNPKIAALHLPSLLPKIKAKEVYCFTIQDGECYKNFQTIQDILQAAFGYQLNRKSLMIAFGGGVVGDIVGFVAGIFMRGIPYIQIPTTLLAQVDSSIGGKTGINNAFGKNLIGLFNQPKAVYIQPNYLQTLPKREFNAGVAEMIKMAVCFDRELFSLLSPQALSQNLLPLLYQALSIKAKVVCEDEKEHGIRAGLNYGHTFGHIIEKEGHYQKYLHGEAISIGMVMANKLARSLGLLSLEQEQAIQDLLMSFDLPTHYQITNPNLFYEQFFLDKKSNDQNLTFVLPKGIGEVSIQKHLSKEQIYPILESFQ